LSSQTYLEEDVGLAKALFYLQGEDFKIHSGKGDGHQWCTWKKLWTERENKSVLIRNDIVNILIADLVRRMHKSTVEIQELETEISNLITAIIHTEDSKDLEATLKQTKFELKKKKSELRPYEIVLKRLHKSTASKGIFERVISLCHDEEFKDGLDRTEYEYPLRDGKVMNFKTFEVCVREKTDYRTFETPVKIIKNPDTTLWDKFFSDICCGNQDVVDYMQAMLGYCLTGNVKGREMTFAMAKA
jgi:hypothetical protein